MGDEDRKCKELTFSIVESTRIQKERLGKVRVVLVLSYADDGGNETSWSHL